MVLEVFILIFFVYHNTTEVSKDNKSIHLHPMALVLAGQQKDHNIQ